MIDDQQRMFALDRANQARMEAARVCAAVRQAGPRGGAREAARVLMAGESPIRIERLVRTVPRVSRAAAYRMIARAQLNPACRVSEVGLDRRQLLAGELLRKAERPWGGE